MPIRPTLTAVVATTIAFSFAGAQVNANEPRDALQTLERARSRFQPSFVNEYFTAMAYGRMKDHTNALKHLVAAEVVARATDTNSLTHKFYFFSDASLDPSFFSISVLGSIETEDIEFWHELDTGYAGREKL